MPPTTDLDGGSEAGDIFETDVDSRSRRCDNELAGGIAAPTRAVATWNYVLTTAKAPETGAGSGRIRFYGYWLGASLLLGFPYSARSSSLPRSGPGRNSDSRSFQTDRREY